MFTENIINLNCCTIIKMPASRVDKFSAGRTKCRSTMKIRTWWNRPAMFLSQSIRRTKTLTLSTPSLVFTSENQDLVISYKFYYKSLRPHFPCRAAVDNRNRDKNISITLRPLFYESKILPTNRESHYIKNKLLLKAKLLLDI